MPNLTSERRRFVRLASECPVKVRCERSGRYLAGQTIDVSEGGCLMWLDARVPVEPGQVVRVGIAKRGQALLMADDLIEGRIVRRFGHGDNQHVAVSFNYARPLAEAG